MLRVHLSAPLLLVLLSLSGSTEARTLSVGTGGEFDTLSAAVTASSTGDVIAVAEGVYDGTRGESFPIQFTHPIRITGPTENVDHAILRGDGQGSLIIGRSVEGIVLEHLMFENGSSDIGGGMRFENAHVTVHRCGIRSNVAVESGAGLYAFKSQIVLTESEVIGNHSISVDGEAIALFQCEVVVKSCSITGNCSSGLVNVFGSIVLEDTTIAENCFVGADIGFVTGPSSVQRCQFAGNGEHGCSVTAPHSSVLIARCEFRDNGNFPDYPFVTEGGGLYLASAERTTIENCVVANNEATVGGGVFIVFGRGEIAHCTFTGNTARYGGSILFERATGFRVRNSIIEDFSEYPIDPFTDGFVSYSAVSGGYPGIGNTSSDPLLRGAENGDFHLLPNSPCIDSASVVGPIDDFAGNPRPVDIPGIEREGNGAFDMGAYEFQLSDLPTPTPSITPTPSVTSNPTETGTPTAAPTPTFNTDINRDGRVDVLDLLILTEDLGKAPAGR
ncbi:MAG: hypothetical protein GHCLOJNM_01800 [bacterium]|nr:hypothetical protein [bacterium]